MQFTWSCSLKVKLLLILFAEGVQKQLKSESSLSLLPGSYIIHTYKIMYYPAFCCLPLSAGVDQGADIPQGLRACSKFRVRWTIWMRDVTFLLDIAFFSHEQLTQNKSVLVPLWLSSFYLDRMWSLVATTIDDLPCQPVEVGHHPYSSMVCRHHFFMLRSGRQPPLQSDSPL